MLEQEVESKFADHNNRLKDFGMINFSIKNLYFTYNNKLIIKVNYFFYFIA